MRFKFPVFPVIAFLAGLAGGWTSRLLPTSKSAGQYGEVRATRIDLVSASGRTSAFIGTDNEHDTALVFLDDKGRERAKFGVTGYGLYVPKLTMMGEDGKRRVALYLSGADQRPMILMADHERTRVHLGFFPSDVPTSTETVADWGIQFYRP